MSWDLLGHEWAAAILRKHLQHGDARHAYLFTGASGIGRRSLALEFAKAINCTQPPGAGEACGYCRVCQQTAKMQQPDLSIVMPEGDSEMIRVDQIRALQHSLSLTPYEAKFRVALLLDMQRANANAQNALLKTLEEAPKQVILLLTADSAENLLPTIASRCEILRLRPVSVETLERALVSRWSIPSEQARLYASVSGGRTGTALRMVQDSLMFEKRSSWLDDLLRLFTLNRRDRFAMVEGLGRDRAQLRQILQVWLSFARDLLLAASGQELKAANIDRLSEIRDLSARLTAAESLRMVETLKKTLGLLEVNANLRLLLDNLMLDLKRLA